MSKWKLILLTLVVVIAGAPGVSRALTCTWKGGDGDWFVDANWINNTPGNGDIAIVDSGSVLLTNSTLNLASFTMNGGTLTCSNWTTKLTATNVTLNGGTCTLPDAFTTSQMSNRIWFACTTLFIGSDATIEANGKGYVYATTGYGPGGGASRAGGGYGGRGGNFTKLGGVTYGSATAPTDPGSAGGGTTGSGGGAVLIEAPEGTVTVNGTITANGVDAVSVYGAGSGGSVYITCLTLAGTNGIVTADGGDTAGNGGAGGGGRIAVIYDPSTQSNAPAVTVRFSANGVHSPGGGSLYPSDLGTLYFPDSQLLTQVIPHSGQWLAPDAANLAFSALTISNGWFRFVQGGTQITVTNDLVVNGSSARLDIGANDVETNLYYDVYGNKLIYNSGAQYPAIRAGGNLILTNSSKLYIYSASTNGGTPDYGALVAITNDLLVYSGSTVYPVSNPTNGGSPLFQLNNLTVSSSGMISANINGFGGAVTGYGPGAGGSRAGGAYGGFGGNFTKVGGLPYGSASAPMSPGSGGGGGIGTYLTGGGLVRIQATETVTINGSILANGQSNGSKIGGGGSGGGIYITCNLLAGLNGTVSADGGSGTSDGNGGGGRIAVIYNTTAQATAPVPSITFSAKGWTVGNYFSDLGTLYFPDNRLLTTNVSHSGQWMVPGANYAFDSLTFTGEWFRFAKGAQVTVTNDVLITGSSSRLDIGGSLFLTNGFYADVSHNQRYNYSESGSSLNCGGNLTLTNGAEFYVFSGATNPPTTSSYGALVSVTGSIFVTPGCSICPVSNPTNGGSVFLRACNVNVSSNALINADYSGYAASATADVIGFGPGTGGTRSGGGYGGTGGYPIGGSTYGNSNAPAQCGSGGGRYTTYGGGGGGLIWIQAGDTITVDGTLSAQGVSIPTYCGSGSGGGIYLICKSFSSSRPDALLQACGGISGTSTANGSGGGGGGRIAVWCYESGYSYIGSMTVTNGTGLDPQATAGTIVIGFLKALGTVVMFR